MNCQHCKKKLDSVQSYHAHNGETGRTDILYLCDDCATKYGFCWSCGTMAADDDWLGRFDICYECWSEMESELESSDDDYYDY